MHLEALIRQDGPSSFRHNGAGVLEEYHDPTIQAGYDRSPCGTVHKPEETN